MVFSDIRVKNDFSILKSSNHFPSLLLRYSFRTRYLRQLGAHFRWRPCDLAEAYLSGLEPNPHFGELDSKP